MAPPSDLPMPPLTAARLVFLAEADHIVRYLLYSALTAMVWDHILTFRREVKYIWRAQWTVSKALFIFNRYVTATIIAGNAWISNGQIRGLSDNVCQKWILVTTAMELLCISFVSFVILFRLHALWGGSRKTFLALLFIWFLSFSSSIIVFFRIVYPVRRFLFHEDYFNICFAVIPRLYLQWLPDALLHILMLSVLVWKAVATPRSSQTHMMGLLYRDGMLYYSSTFTVLVTGMLIWAFGDIAWIGIPFNVGWIICQISMSRLLMGPRTSQAFQLQAELIRMRHQRRATMLRGISPMVSVESYGAYVLETVKSGRSDVTNRYDPALTYYCEDGIALRPIPTATTVRSMSTAVTREEARELRTRQRTRAGQYQDTRWWWLRMPGSGEDRVSIDANVVESWDPRDPGPGVKESRLGKYNHWL